MGLRQIGPRNDLRFARIADVDGGEILRRALMRQPEDATTILGYLNRHALANAAEPIELVMRELPKIPNRRLGHLHSLPLIGADRSTRWPQPSRAALKCGLRWYPPHDVCYPSPPRKRVQSRRINRLNSRPAENEMQFGVQFFPDVKPEQKAGAEYFREALTLAEEADNLGFTHIRIVEHYFHHYGGYSPNPMLFLAAAAQRTRQARLVTRAVLLAFNHPLKLAGEIGMLDAISGCRLDVGFARAFLPHEFRRFGISLDESRERFDEGLEQIDLMLTQENVTHRGRFHTIVDTTSLPRPTQ